MQYMTKLMVIAATATLVACGGGSGSSSDTGTLNLSVSDAPVDAAAAVWVEFTGVELKAAGSQLLTIEYATPKKINLLDLQGGISEPLISNQTVTAGKYEWVRLKVNAHSGVLDSYIEFENGDQVSLLVPSGNQTGLKLVNPFFITAGGTSNFTIDFDLRKSVTNPLGRPDYILKPAIRIVDNSLVGQVSGIVDRKLFDQDNCSTDVDRNTGVGGAVYLYKEWDATIDDAGSVNPPLSSALVGLNIGTGLLEYKIGFVSAGEYSIAFTCESLDDGPESDDAVVIDQAKNISVVEGKTSNANF